MSLQCLYQRRAMLLDHVNCSIILLDSLIKHWAFQAQLIGWACHSNFSVAVTMSCEMSKEASYATAKVLMKPSTPLFVPLFFYYSLSPLSFSHCCQLSTMVQVWSIRWATGDKMCQRTGRSIWSRDTRSWWRTLPPLCPMRSRSKLEIIRVGAPSPR